MRYQYNDGGRAAAGYKGTAGDCGVRAVAITTGLPYQRVYDDFNELGKKEPLRGKYKNRPSNARKGLWHRTVHKYLVGLGFRWVPTMAIGSGCKVHVKADELPSGTLVLRLSRHYAAVIDGTLYDTYDSRRDGSRCVYGYWMK